MAAPSKEPFPTAVAPRSVDSTMGATADEDARTSQAGASASLASCCQTGWAEAQSAFARLRSPVPILDTLPAHSAAFRATVPATRDPAAPGRPPWTKPPTSSTGCTLPIISAALSLTVPIFPAVASAAGAANLRAVRAIPPLAAASAATVAAVRAAGAANLSSPAAFAPGIRMVGSAPKFAKSWAVAGFAVGMNAWSPSW